MREVSRDMINLLEMLSSKPASEERAILGVTKEQQANSLMSEMANKAVESQSKNIQDLDSGSEAEMT